MTHFAFLGTSGAIPSRARDTTSLVFVGPEGAVLGRFGGVVEIAQEFVPYPL